MGQNLQYGKLYRTLKYHKNGAVPKNPKTIDEVKEYFNSDAILERFSQTLHEKQPHKFYQETIITPHFAYSLMTSELILNDLPENLRIRIDGTFKIVPKGTFKQLIIISCDFSNHESMKY